MNDTSASNLSADSPITDLAADRLGYRPFAEKIATILDNATTREDCLVLGIHGEWGSGKTSAINLIINYLESLQRCRPQYVRFKELNDCFLYKTFEPDRPFQIKETKPRTTIIHFSPWLFSNQENLTTAFFHELEKQLDNTWGNIKGFLKVIAALTLPSLEALSYLNPTTSKLVGNTTQHLIKNLQKRPSLEQAKQALNKALKAQKRPILIIIDDIDRLPADEMRQIFRMVKSVADLPYVTYLLGFDRKIVASALEKDTDLEGPQWIEKIVQGSFDLPHIIPFKLRRFFWTQIETEIPDLYRQFDDHTSFLFDNFLFPQLKNPRQVTRLINALIVGWLSVQNIVNPTLFVIIEAWRLFNHGLYEFIKNNRNCICYDTKNDNTLATFKQKISVYNNELNINLDHFFARNNDSPTLNLDYTISNSKFFYNYFIYNNDSQLLSSAELEEIECNLDDIERAKEIINKFSNEILDHTLSKNRALLFYWRQNLSSFPEDKITKIVYLIVCMSDQLISTEKKSIEYNIQNEIDALIISSFINILNSALQKKLILKLYNNFPFMPLLINRFSDILFVNNDPMFLGSNPLNSLLKQHQDLLKDIYRTKIKELSSTDQNLPLSPNFILLFFHLLDKEWINNFLCNNQNQAIQIMSFFTKTLFQNLDAYNHFTNVSPLRNIAENVLVSDNNESHKQIAKKFLSILR